MGRPPVYQFGWGPGAPTTRSLLATSGVLGQYFQFTQPGWVVGARYYLDSLNSGLVFAILEDVSVQNLRAALVSFKHPPQIAQGSSGWQHAYFHPRVRVNTTHAYQLRVWQRLTPFWRTPGGLATAVVNDSVTVLADGTSGVRNGWTATSSNLFSPQSNLGDFMGIDVIFFQQGT